jgi:hypothetical protein
MGLFLSFQILFLFSFDGDRSPARSRLLFVLAVYGRDMFPGSGMKAGGPPSDHAQLYPATPGRLLIIESVTLSSSGLGKKERAMNVSLLPQPRSGDTL